MTDLFALPELKFPVSFLWGSSSSAYQTEGGNSNNDWFRSGELGKFPEACGRACNHYEMWREDVALLKKLGHQVFRTGVEWSRVETSEGVFDADATAHYVEYFRTIRDAGIRPWVTLFHFTNPIWFADKGEWNKRENVDCFLRFVEYIVPKIAPYVSLWLPINEYNFYTGAPVAPADHHRLANYAFNILRADAGAYDIIKSFSDRPCASPMAFLALKPARAHDVFDRTFADYADWCANGWYYHAIRTGELVFPFTDAEYLPAVKGRADFWAVNMYARDLVSSRHASTRAPRHHHRSLVINKSHEQNPWEITPDELMENLHRLRDKPVYITENGCNTDNDAFRIAYIATHLAAFRQAMDDGVDIRCFLYWSLLDNYEWGSFDPKFGLVEVDRETFRRTPKPSASFFREVIKSKSISGRLVRKYLEAPPFSKPAH